MPEPPRNRKGYRLCSCAAVLVKKLIGDGRPHRTIVHKGGVEPAQVVTEMAQEVSQFLRDGQIGLRSS